MNQKKYSMPLKNKYTRKQREEIEELCEDAYDTGHDRCAWEEGYDGAKGISIENWKKENL